MKSAEVAKSMEQFGLHLPMFSSDMFTGLANVAPLLATAIPLGIYNFTEAMNNVESASAAGDNYNLRKVLIADGWGAAPMVVPGYAMFGAVCLLMAQQASDDPA